jgi:choline dehydrogenase
LYLARSNEDPQMALDYEVAHYPASGPANVTMWYPRGSALGGSTAMNALIHLRPHNYDLDKMATELKDDSWSVSTFKSIICARPAELIYAGLFDAVLPYR